MTPFERLDDPAMYPSLWSLSVACARCVRLPASAGQNNPEPFLNDHFGRESRPVNGSLDPGET